MKRQKIRKALITISTLLFPLSFFFLSPFVIVISAINGVLNGSAVFFGCLLVFSVFGSRLFCGWLCPGGGIQDAVSSSNDRKWNSAVKNMSKYIIWAVWLLFIIFLWTRHLPLHINPLYFIQIDTPYLIIYAIVVSCIYLFSLFTGKRGMCHSLCWMAPFMVIGEKLADLLHIPRFRLKSVPDTCISCEKCSRICPMGLPVFEMVKDQKMDHTECIHCLSCIDTCPKKSIKCGFFHK